MGRVLDPSVRPGPLKTLKAFGCCQPVLALQPQTQGFMGRVAELIEKKCQAKARTSVNFVIAAVPKEVADA